MTNGSSQGLFVVVAVVIFGIFVAIAYTLFEDNLKPALASMFRDVAEQTEKIVTGDNHVYKPLLSPVRVVIVNDDYKDTGIYKLKWDGTDTTIWGGTLPSGISLNYLPVLNWGERITVSFDIVSPVDSIAGVDFNARALGEEYITNDWYGNHSSKDFLRLFQEIKANEKTTIEYSIKNDNSERNPKKLPISEYSIIGIQTNLLAKNPTFEISNVSYEITRD